MSPFLEAAGRALRRARLEAGQTLRDVKRRSAGRFKPSSVGAYERAERAISLDRFVALTRLYGVTADGLLKIILEDIAAETASASEPPARVAHDPVLVLDDSVSQAKDQVSIIAHE